MNEIDVRMPRMPNKTMSLGMISIISARKLAALKRVAEAAQVINWENVMRNLVLAESEYGDGDEESAFQVCNKIDTLVEALVATNNSLIDSLSARDGEK